MSHRLSIRVINKGRLKIRWWKHKSFWVWGPRHRPGEYHQLQLGPLEIVLRSKQRARRIIGDVAARNVPSTDTDD